MSKLFREQLSRAIEPRSHSTHRTIGSLGYFFIAQAFYIFQNDYHSQFGFEAEQGFMNVALYLLLQNGRLDSLRASRQRQGREVVGRIAGVSAFAFAIIEAAIDRETIEPSREARLPLVLIEFLIRPQKNLLRHVFRRFVMAGHAVSETVRARVITLVQMREHVRPPGEHEPHQFFIRSGFFKVGHLIRFGHTQV